MDIVSLLTQFLGNVWVQLAVTVGAILVIPWFLLDFGTRLRNFSRRPKLQVTIKESGPRLAWIVKNSGKNAFENLRLLIRCPGLGASGLLFWGLNLDSDEELEVSFDIVNDSIALQANFAPSIDRGASLDYRIWGRYGIIQWGSNYEFQLTFKASNIRDSDAKPKRYNFVPRSLSDLELSESK